VVADPAAAAKKRAKHWEGLGYTVHTVFPPDPTNHNVTQIAGDFPNGGGLGYAVSTIISSIDAESECSSDPDMLTTTK
jgi:hypothetical protein